MDVVPDSTKVYSTVLGKLEILGQKEKRDQRLPGCGVRWLGHVDLFIFFF